MAAKSCKCQSCIARWDTAKPITTHPQWNSRQKLFDRVPIGRPVGACAFACKIHDNMENTLYLSLRIRSIKLSAKVCRNREYDKTDTKHTKYQIKVKSLNRWHSWRVLGKNLAFGEIRGRAKIGWWHFSGNRIRVIHTLQECYQFNATENARLVEFTCSQMDSRMTELLAKCMR